MNSEKPTIRPDPEILRKTAIFRSLDESDFRTLLVCLRGRTCPAGEILFSEGDPGQSMMIVAEGTFVALVRRKDGIAVTGMAWGGNGKTLAYGTESGEGGLLPL